MAALTHCPLCATAWRPGHSDCSCGYDPSVISALERERSIWRKRRNRWVGIGAVGFAIAVLPAVPLDAAALIGGYMTSAGAVVAAWSALSMRKLRRAIRAAQTPRLLPEARVR